MDKKEYQIYHNQWQRDSQKRRDTFPRHATPARQSAKWRDGGNLICRKRGPLSSTIPARINVTNRTQSEHATDGDRRFFARERWYSTTPTPGSVVDALTTNVSHTQRSFTVRGRGFLPGNIKRAIHESPVFSFRPINPELSEINPQNQSRVISPLSFRRCRPSQSLLRPTTQASPPS